MANLRNIGSLLSNYTSHRNNQNPIPNDKDIVKEGYLQKQKDMKNRFFVLRRETNKYLPARLECYDSKEKVLGYQPKKKYILEKCFNIIQKRDNNVFVISFHYVNKNCVTLVAQTEDDLNDWFSVLHQHKYSEANPIDSPRREYEHVWQVEVLKRNLGSDSSHNIVGQNWLCLNNQYLSLVRVDNQNIKKEFHLNTIKLCCRCRNFFFILLGRFSGIGKGGITIETGDSKTAENICTSVSSAMSNFQIPSTREPKVRKRSNSYLQPEATASESRGRSDSVPNQPWNPSLASRFHSFFEGIHNHNSVKMFANNWMKRGQLTPEQEFMNFEETSSDYLDMSCPKEDRVLPSSYPSWVLEDIKSDEDSVYTPMDSGVEGFVPSVSEATPSRVTSPMDVIPSSLLSPVSLNSLGTMTSVSSLSSSSGGISYMGSGCSTSPQTSIGSHSRSPSLEQDEYVLMLSPGTQGMQLSQRSPEPSAPYLDMGPGPHGVERRRTISTPIALSASEAS